jgi:hypothetical protein
MKRIECLLYARDVYSVWRSRTRNAETSITVFAPFMDRVLVSLLSANRALHPSNITIITNFTVDTLLESPNQLRTIKRLMQKGFQVLRLDGLHAKVLLIDDAQVVLGSQNFTSHARRNKEVSARPTSPVTNTQFLETLLDWRQQAQPVEEAYIDMLLACLRRHIRQHKEVLRNATTTAQQVSEEYERQQQEALIDRLPDLERQSPIKLAHGVIYATIRPITSSYMWTKGPSFDSLLAGSQYDMTLWERTKKDGSTEASEINRLSMYPVLIAETLRMGFARVGKTRITYIRNLINWGTTFRIGDRNLSICIRFPYKDTRRRNIIVTLTDSLCGKCECAFLFAGDKVRLVHHKFSHGQLRKLEPPSGYNDFTKLLTRMFLRSPKMINEFFRKFFGPFKYNVLESYDHNIRKYLDGYSFRLSLIEFMSRPVLVIKKEC